MTTKSHGGTRNNSGRKLEVLGEKTKRVNLSLDQRTLDMLKVVGGGNVSRGVRKAARMAYEDYQNS
jgi:uridylate kinase